MIPQPNVSTAQQRLFQLCLLIFALICSVQVMLTPSTAQSSEERVLEDKIPRHLPIKVKIKKEKERAFRDLNNEKWVRDLELEVTNTGDKPIYFLDLELILPEVKSPAGYEIGFPLRYGRIQLVDLRASLLPEDVPILPGQTHIFKISEENAKGWEIFTSQGKIQKMGAKRIKLEFYLLNFGDGTGFRMNIGEPFPKPSNSRSSKAPCIDVETLLVLTVSARSSS